MSRSVPRLARKLFVAPAVKLRERLSQSLVIRIAFKGSLLVRVGTDSERFDACLTTYGPKECSDSLTSLNWMTGSMSV